MAKGLGDVHTFRRHHTLQSFGEGPVLGPRGGEAELLAHAGEPVVGTEVGERRYPSSARPIARGGSACRGTSRRSEPDSTCAIGGWLA